MEWKAELITHRQKKRIAVWFSKEPALITRIRKLTDARWSATLKVWHLPDTSENRLRFKISTASALNLDKIDQIEQFRVYLQVKRYSDSTSEPIQRL